MTDRFSSMIGIMNNCVKTGLTSCELPTNTFSTNILRLLREQGYIYGFSEVSPRKKEARLYPRARIFFKYIDSKTPILKSINVFKHTRSNFNILRKNNLNKILVQRKLYILTTVKGLTITSFQEFYRKAKRSRKALTGGKLLAEIVI